MICNKDNAITEEDLKNINLRGDVNHLKIEGFSMLELGGRKGRSESKQALALDCHA